MSKKELREAAERLIQRHRVVKTFSKPSLTKQSFKEESDLNNIMRKYEATGQLPFGRNGVPMFGDFSNLPTSYHDACNRVLQVETLFASLGSRVREKFRNDPQSFINFMATNPSQDALRELGLVGVDPTPQPASRSAGQAAPPQESTASGKS